MASGRSAVLTVKILTDASGSQKGIDQALTGYQKFEQGVNKLVPAAAATVAAIGAIGVKAVDSASRTEQAMGALDSVFGDNSATVKAWADTAAQSVGLAKSEYGELASVAGAQLQNLGLSAEDALSGTQGLISLGADLAATFGGSTTDAVNALSAALRGEADPAERYGLSLNQTAVNAYLAEQGLADLEGEALRTAKTQAILQMATEQAGGALGQFERESDTVAGSQQRAAAEFENAASTLGTALLPMVAAVANAFGEFARWVQENSTLVTVLIGVIGAIAGIILTLSVAMKVAAVAQWALNSALLANPITWIILAVIALVAAFVWLWNNVEGFRNFFIGVWDAIVTAVTAVVDWFVAAWTAVCAWFEEAWANIAAFFQGIWDGIVAVVAAVVAWFQGIWAGVAGFFQGIVTGWQIIFTAVFNAVRGVINGVAAFFQSIWQGAVNAVTNVIRTMQNIFTSVFNAIMVPINAVSNAFSTVVGWIRSVIDWLGKIKIPDIFGAIGGMFGGGGARSMAAGYTVTNPAGPAGFAASVAAARAPRLRAVAGGAASIGGGTVINLTVNGAVDPDAVARQLQRIFTGRDRRTGGTVLPRRTT